MRKSSRRAAGRPRITQEKEDAILALRRKGHGILKIARMAGVGSGTVQRVLKERPTRVDVKK